MFLAIGWIMTYMVNKVEKFPILEYQVLSRTIVQSIPDSVWRYEYQVANITYDQKFDSIDLYFTYQNVNNHQIVSTGTTAIGIPPAMFEAVGNAQKAELEYVIKGLTFQPQTALKIYVRVNGPQAPVLTFQAADEIMLVERSFLTILYRNYLIVIVVLIVIWIILIALYLRAYSSAQPRFSHRKK